jgi:phosphoesterase RecJ-like protein
MNKKLVSVIKGTIREANHILITSHTRPDGDAVGSLLGLGIALQEAGKTVQMVLEDGVPGSLDHLKGSEEIRKEAIAGYDISIVLDCSDLDRVGRVFEKNTIPTINIDHHATNLNFAHINLVEMQEPATTVILTKLIRSMGYSISQPAANALLTGLITDTIGFRTTNITAEAMRIAADLMEQGANLPSLYKKALLDMSFPAARFWGAGLSSLQLENRLLWVTLTQTDRKAAGYHGKDDADLINFLSSIKDADVYVIFVEQPDQTVKVSWRAQAGYDVSQIAAHFGGGGHKPAAGAMISGQLDFVKEKVLDITRQLFLTPQSTMQ